MSTRHFAVRSAADLGRMVGEARTIRRLTQSELAALTRVDRTYLSRLEAGHTTLQVERALEMLRRLGVTLHGTMEIENDNEIEDGDA